MTSADVGLVQRGYEAWNRGDVEAVIEFLDPEIKWEGYTHIPESGTLTGRDEVKAWLERFLEAWPTGSQVRSGTVDPMRTSSKFSIRLPLTSPTSRPSKWFRSMMWRRAKCR